MTLGDLLASGAYTEQQRQALATARAQGITIGDHWEWNAAEGRFLPPGMTYDRLLNEIAWGRLSDVEKRNFVGPTADLSIMPDFYRAGLTPDDVRIGGWSAYIDSLQRAASAATPGSTMQSVLQNQLADSIALRDSGAELAQPGIALDVAQVLSQPENQPMQALEGAGWTRDDGPGPTLDGSSCDRCALIGAGYPQPESPFVDPVPNDVKPAGAGSVVTERVETLTPQASLTSDPAVTGTLSFSIWGVLIIVGAIAGMIYVFKS